uniref:Uncharacterized protein n=1 Tax=Alexandrium andersonii TaxID=327968 RepID=A0A7S2FMF7_9DINO|mmetsp:Transcript_27206/g.62023  ORF Transcript_27206/g.62023 Transcript_27206/m.62023 type:complete len:176 (+) Transcript_27206:68-595(+)
MPSLLVRGGTWRADAEWWLRTSVQKELRLQVHSDEVSDMANWLESECPKSLQSLELSTSDFNASLAIALEASRIRRLRIFQTELPEDAGVLLASILVNNQYLREFELAQNSIDDVAAEYIAEGIARSDSLRKFVLAATNDVSSHGWLVMKQVSAANARIEVRGVMPTAPASTAVN